MPPKRRRRPRPSDEDDDACLGPDEICYAGMRVECAPCRVSKVARGIVLDDCNIAAGERERVWRISWDESWGPSDLTDEQLRASGASETSLTVGDVFPHPIGLGKARAGDLYDCAREGLARAYLEALAARRLRFARGRGASDTEIAAAEAKLARCERPRACIRGREVRGTSQNRDRPPKIKGSGQSRTARQLRVPSQSHAVIIR